MTKLHIVNHNMMYMIPICKKRTSMLEDTNKKNTHSIHKRNK